MTGKTPNGTVLGHYEILGLLGKGGMGEVYRARDRTLNREVALKLLPAELSGDPERVARFAREATTLAKLQHTNIATIYGFEQGADPDHGQPFLVMELVEGEDLAERLLRGPLPVEEALLLAVQIAEGVEAAHKLGIVHRDLKPANIKLTPSGNIKLLDFGLARAFDGEAERVSTLEISNSPTITAAMTQAGVILGTAAYMSPEQARGKAIDKQADVWSFGVVLYEMLTTERLFGGETVSDSIGAILHRDPDLTRLPTVPPQVTTLLRRCLARDKRQRLQDIGDARLELEDAIAARGRVEQAAGRRRARLPWLVAGALGLATVALGWVALTRAPAQELKATTLGLGHDQNMNLGTTNSWPRMQFAPDGRQVAYVGGPRAEIYRRDLDSFDSKVIPGTAGTSLFTISPDSRWIAYMQGARLWKVALSGGAPIPLCETLNGPGLAWGRDEIYFARGAGGGLWAVSVDGGEPRPISALDQTRDETSHRWPHVLPDGRHLLITIKTAHITSFDDALIAVLSLETGAVTVLVQGGTYAQYASTGHIVYGRQTQLFAVPFDEGSLTVEGTPVGVLADVSTVEVNGTAQFSLSPDGKLAYLPSGRDRAELDLVWVHLSGRISSFEVAGINAFQLSISPDGRKLAGMVPAANDKIFILDFQRKTMTRLTSTPGNDTAPVWSPDGRLIAYVNDRGGSDDIYVMAADGGSAARPLRQGPEDFFPEGWTPDGTRLVHTRLDAGGKASLWIMPVDGSAEPTLLIEDNHSNGMGRISPDGRWLLYLSDSSGEFEVYVRPFERAGQPARISIAGGDLPQWSPDGRTIYYLVDSRMMAVPVDGADRFQVGEPREIVDLGETIFDNLPLAPDGERFLGVRRNPELGKEYGIRVVFDWAEKLKKAGR